MKKISKESWKRIEHFNFFSPLSNPFYSITFTFDVTNLYKYVKQRNISFYYAMIYASTEVMNSIEDFRYKIRDESIICHEKLIPSFVDMRKDSELFHIVTLEAGDSIDSFCIKAKEQSTSQKEYFPKCSFDGDSLIYFSSLPWFDFTSLTNERDLNKDDSIPRITWGKYTSEGDTKILHYSIEVNHRLIDGVHIGKFHQQLQNYLNSL